MCLLPIFALLGFSLAIRLPTLWIPHIENDEVIYQTLAAKITWNLKNYTLRGSNLSFRGQPLLKLLPSYDKPLFHHPPLFIWLLALTQKIAGTWAEPIVPMAAGLLAILLVYLISRERFGRKAGLFAATIAAASPVLLLASTKIWMDSLLCALVCASYYALVRAARTPERRAAWALAGAALGLALITKVTALCFIPVPILFFLKRRFSFSRSLLFWGPAFVIAAPWFAFFHHTYGAFFPYWIKPSAAMMRIFPQMARVVHLPFYFYFTHLILIMPLYLLILPELRSRESLREDLPEIAWAACFLLAFTVIGMTGGGCQTRYVLPGLPPLALLGGKFLARKNEKILILAVLLAAYSLATGLANVYLIPHGIEVMPLFHLLP